MRSTYPARPTRLGSCTMILLVCAGMTACFGGEFTSVGATTGGDGGGGVTSGVGTTGSGGGEGGAGQASSSASSGGGTMEDGGVDASAPDPCAEPNLVACYRFDGTTEDGSKNHNDAAGIVVEYTPGVDGQALVVGPNSAVKAPNGPSWGIAAYTIEAWVWPNVIPTGDERMGVFDHDTRYGLFIYGKGMRCGTGGVSVYGSMVAATSWTHLACTHDGTTLRAYMNGVEVASIAAEPLDTSPSGPVITIGSNAPDGSPFDGAIDQLRVFDVARGPKKICEAAGGSGC